MTTLGGVTLWFESYVNFAGNKTALSIISGMRPFESYVNFAGNKTRMDSALRRCRFESYVNFAGNKTQTIKERTAVKPASSV